MPPKKKAPTTAQSDLTAPEPTTPPAGSATPDFPIVGIGTSAGGLETLEAFFRKMPSDSGMAFVLIQHLDPTHDSILVELVRRYTPMEVCQIEDGMRVAPNCIYIIPPNRDLALLHGKLHLVEPLERRGLRLPIDFFFRSLAEDLAERSIGVILSGTGSDGTLGLKEIRGAGGMTMVQDPETAKYAGMPRSAIATGMVDYVLAPEDMPGQLRQYTERFFGTMLAREAAGLPSDTAVIEKIFILLRRHTKHDFALYKRNTINRRIERRMAVNQVERLEDYLRYLRQHPLEVDTLFQEMLIGVTSFFRDPEAFDVLERKAIAPIVASKEAEQPIRIWVPGCSTGEEAYSIAILLLEQMSQQDRNPEVQIFATDIDERAIEKARAGVYPESIVADVSPERLQRFFVKQGNTYCLNKQVREMVVFAVQNIAMDPPFSRMDLISCRNLLIYLGQDLQRKVIPLFHYALAVGGFLFLGPSETLGTFDSYLQPIDRKTKLFQRVTNDKIPQSLLFFAPPPLFDGEFRMSPAKPEKASNIRELAEKTLLQEYTPPCVIVNEQSDILFFHGKTAAFLDPASGEASLNILRMIRENLRLPISAALRKAFAQKHEVIYERVPLSIGQPADTINIVVRPLRNMPAEQPLYLVIFEETHPVQSEPASPDISFSDQQMQDLERELQSTKEYLQTTIEELETANEELTSTNEELQSTNEELQSTNEEMETAKEELQSVNEELVTVNSELQSKLDELVRANNDLNNLLANVEVGIIFLDEQLHIQRFNKAATQLINLIHTDLGRPINHIASNLIYDDLVRDAQAVLDTLIPRELEVQTPEKQWFSMRIKPYRTIENAIIGLVVTFAEITEQKSVQDQLARARDYAQSIVSTIREPLVVLDERLQVVSASRSFFEVFQETPQSTAGRSIYEIGQHQWDVPGLRELLENILKANESFENYRLEYESRSAGVRVLLLNARQMYSMEGQSRLILMAFEDITEHAG